MPRRARRPGRAAACPARKLTDVPDGPDTELDELDPELPEAGLPGLMTISRSLARAKLQVMVEAARQLRDEIR